MPQGKNTFMPRFRLPPSLSFPPSKAGFAQKKPCFSTAESWRSPCREKGTVTASHPAPSLQTSAPPSVTAVTLILPMPLGGKEKLYLKANFKSKGEITLCLSGGLYFSLQVVLMMSPLSRMATACGRMWLMVPGTPRRLFPCAWPVGYREGEPTPADVNTLLIFVDVGTIKSSLSAVLEDRSVRVLSIPVYLGVSTLTLMLLLPHPDDK